MTAAATSMEARFRSLLVARSPEERLRMAARMFAGARELVRAGLVGPGDDTAQRRHIFCRFYGGDFPSAERERILTYLVTPR
jgi:hypothetical protein